MNLSLATKPESKHEAKQLFKNATKQVTRQPLGTEIQHKLDKLKVKPESLSLLKANTKTPALKNNLQAETELTNAVLSNNLEKVETILKDGANPNEKDRLGNTLLHNATLITNKEMVEMLLKYKADPDLKNNSGDTVLHQVARMKNMDMAQLIVPISKTINEKNEMGYTALHYALNGEKTDLLKLLVAHKADPNIKDPKDNTSLHISINMRNSEAASILLDAGANPSLDNGKKEPPVISVIYNGMDDILKKLLDKGADANQKHIGTGCPPLHFAIMKNSLSAVNILLEKGANPNMETPTRTTFLIQAVEKGNVEMVEALVKKGAELSKCNSNGENVLTTAAKNGNIFIVESLLKQGININLENNITGKTALHMSAKNGHEQMAKFLVMKGSDLNYKDNEGNTPIFDVIPQVMYWWQMPSPTPGQSEIASFLLHKGADIKQYETDNFFVAQLADVLNVKHPGEGRNFLYSRVDNEWEKLDSRRVDAVLDQFATKKTINDSEIDKLLLKLLHPDIDYKNDTEATRHASHLRSWRGNVNREGKPVVEAEGWWMHVYPPLKMKSLIMSLNKINNNQINCMKEFGEPKEKVLHKVKHEIASQMSTYYTQRHHDMMRMISDVKFSDEFKTKEASKYCKEIVKAPVGTEWSMSSGFPGHAIYMGFRKQDPDNVSRIVYNLGGGLQKHIFNAEGKAFPHVVKDIKIDHFLNESPQAINYIKGVIDAKLGKFRDPLPSVYENIAPLGGVFVKENIPGIPQKRQTAGNCVLKNNNVAGRNRIKNDRLFKFLKKEETKFADEFSQIDKKIIAEKEKERQLDSFNYVIEIYNQNKNMDAAIKNILEFLEKRNTQNPEVANGLRGAERVAFYLQKTDEKTLDQMMLQKGAVKLLSDMAEMRYCDTLKQVVDKYSHNSTMANIYQHMYNKSFGKF